MRVAKSPAFGRLDNIRYSAGGEKLRQIFCDIAKDSREAAADLLNNSSFACDKRAKVIPAAWRKGLRGGKCLRIFEKQKNRL